MNKTELKNFAVSARRDLLEKVTLRAKIFGIDEKTGLTIEEQFGQLAINGNTYPLYMKSAFQPLSKQLEAKGYEQLIEDAAYTWFNRIIAIRYMEVHDYLPERVNIFSSSSGKVEPDILSQFETMDLDIDTAEVKDLVRQGETEKAYRKLFIAQCNALYKVLPFLFEKIHDYTELLLPDFLLDSESVIRKLVQNVSRENFRNEEGKDNVEVLGWLYQYYMSEKKEKVGGLKNTAVKKEDLPVVTQLFTPKWIVQYMVQNSLGKLYDEKYPANRLSSNWEYYLKSSVEEKLVPECNSLEEITFIDPACGSGHILVYAFDLLYDMYEEAGYPSREIPKLILENNLYGLDIDKRAQQIANFALVMKAVEKQPRFLKRNQNVNVNVLEMQDTDYSLSKEAINFFAKDQTEIEKIKELQDTFESGKQFGSLIIPSYMNYEEWIERIENIEVENADLVEQTYSIELTEKLLPLLKQAWLLNQKYDVVVTNPPYHNKYNDVLKSFMNKYYKNYKSDLYSAFIYRTIGMTKEKGYSALMTPFTWMFIVTHESLRKHIITHYSVSSLVQLEYSAFKEATVPVCTFVIQNQKINSIGQYVRLTNFIGEEVQPLKVREAVTNSSVGYRYTCDSNVFHEMPSTQFAYWSTEKIRKIFTNNPSIGDVADVKQGLATADDDRFLRKWFEVDVNKIGFGIRSRTTASESNKKWFPFNKGGKFRKWYGNNSYVVNWENDGSEIRNCRDKQGKIKSRPQNLPYYFKSGISWGLVSSGKASFRLSEEGYIPGHKGSVIYFNDQDYKESCFSILNSKVAFSILEMIAPNIGFEAGSIKTIPILHKEIFSDLQDIKKIVTANIEISSKDWDSFETSWEFKHHPLLTYREDNTLLSGAFENWTNHTEFQFTQLKANEEELNGILIELYGLQDELTPEVLDDEITIRKADRNRDTKSFLSYFIGCMMGRYSLDVEELGYASGEWDESKYKTFKPNKYGLTVLTDEHYFEDDVIARLREFLTVTFGSEMVEENLQWLAESLELKRNETAEERLRRYFLDEFFKDHCQVYQKRPIYWLVDSGKQKGLRTLIYMHRYQRDTMATIRFEHLQEIQSKYNNEIAAVDLRVVNPNLSATEKRGLEKRKAAYQQRLEELLVFDKKLAEYANAQITIDLDDGVKVNYEEFDKVLAPIK